MMMGVKSFIWVYSLNFVRENRKSSSQQLLLEQGWYARGSLAESPSHGLRPRARMSEVAQMPRLLIYITTGVSARKDVLEPGKVEVDLKLLPLPSLPQDVRELTSALI